MKADFRLATETDHQQIVDLISNMEELFFVGPQGEYPSGADRIKWLITVRDHPTVILFEGMVIGFACLLDIREGKSATIGNVIIDQNYRGRGFGRLLIEYMIDCAFKNCEISEVNIGVFNANTRAILLYNSIGFIPCGIQEMRDFSNNRVALIYMKIMLTQWNINKSLNIFNKPEIKHIYIPKKP
jgi:ribosomal protein S18 acetylase RimI-like enzyme